MRFVLLVLVILPFFPLYSQELKIVGEHGDVRAVKLKTASANVFIEYVSSNSEEVVMLSHVSGLLSARQGESIAEGRVVFRDVPQGVWSIEFVADTNDRYIKRVVVE